MPRVLSIYLPDWPIWLAKRKGRSEPTNTPGDGDTRRKPTAWLLWREHRANKYVARGCPLAQRAGVQSGMTLAHAQSLLAGIPTQAQAYTPESDAQSLTKLAETMLRFAPTVAPDVPDGLILDIAGCEGLFGGERQHARLITDTLNRWRLRSRFAVAPTAGCSWAVARYGPNAMEWVMDGAVDGALALLPIQALRLDERTIDALADVGIERIEHLQAQPRDELAARFGPELLRRLDLATGAASETIHGIQPERRFELHHVFDGPIRRLEIVEATTHRLVDQLLQELHTVQCGVLELHVEWQRVALEPVILTLRLTVANNDPAHVWKLLSTRMERVNLGFGVETIIVRAIRTDRICNEQTAFLRDAAHMASDSSSALGELVDHFVNRFGNDAVTQAQPVATYVPERAFAHSAVQLTMRALRVAESPVDPSHRPSQLFDTPEPARVLSLVPDGPPIRLEWRGETAEIVSSIGPERIAFPWWTGRPAVSRDYYEVEDTRGRRLWVFRDTASRQWFVHGEWT